MSAKKSDVDDLMVLYPCCAGLDVHKKTVVACIITTGAHGKVSRQVRTFATTTVHLLELSDWLAEHEVSHVAMESTGVYTPPTMWPIVGGGLRRGWQHCGTDTEHHTYLLFINFDTLDQG